MHKLYSGKLWLMIQEPNLLDQYSTTQKDSPKLQHIINQIVMLLCNSTTLSNLTVHQSANDSQPCKNSFASQQYLEQSGFLQWGSPQDKTNGHLSLRTSASSCHFFAEHIVPCKQELLYESQNSKVAISRVYIAVHHKYLIPWQVLFPVFSVPAYPKL